MTMKTTSCQLNIAETKLALKKYIRRFDQCTRDTQALYVYTILAFLESLQRNHPHPPGMIVVNESRLLEWMVGVSTARSFTNAAQKLPLINRFMEYLNDTGVVDSNPMANIRARYDRHGWAGIIRALRSHDPTAALARIRAQPTYHGDFGRHAQRYIELHRAAGKKYRHNEEVLIDFNRFLQRRGNESVREVTSEIVHEWASLNRTTSRSLRRQLQILRQFFRYACGLKAIRTNPVTEQILDEVGIPKRTFRPHIFTVDQVRALLAAARNLTPTNTFPLRPEVMYAIISVLYTLGLRISEAVRLTVGDIDEEREAILVRETKFYKERYVPYGPKLARCLERYFHARRKVAPAPRKQDPVFIGWARRPATVDLIRRHFKDVLRAASADSTNASASPRVYDLRHTFAVHRLLRWYREGVDVQERLVLLSTFMGHIGIYSTQCYLTITGALLEAANDRFHATFGGIADKEPPQ